jgi:hypothetical protein
LPGSSPSPAERHRGRAALRESVELTFQTDCVNMQADALVDLAETLRLLGRPGPAAEILEQAVELYERKGNIASAAAAQTLIAPGQPVEG